MDKITKYNDLDTFLKRLGLEFPKSSDFYIFKLEELKNINIDIGTHCHEFFEVSFYCGYDIDLHVEHETKNTDENSLCFVSPNQLIRLGFNKRRDDSIGYTIFFKPEFLDFTRGAHTIYKAFPFFNRNTNATYYLDENQRKAIISLMKKIHEEHEKFDENSDRILASYLTILLYTCKREFNQNHYLTRKQRRPEEITFKFENLVQESTNIKLPISHFAKKLNISPVYLSECIKKSTGKTAKQIIDEYIIIEAKTFLKHSSKTIFEISFELGFEDNSNFGKYFKKHTGISPLKFRNT